jgi:prepilin signal peptidase PulO-like enzyme (type II secretory pathway)
LLIGICQREGICGPKSAICSEESTSFSSYNITSRFGCFCSSGFYKIGEKCPDEIDTTTPFIISTEEISTVSILITTVRGEITDDTNVTNEITTNTFPTDASTQGTSIAPTTTDSINISLTITTETPTMPTTTIKCGCRSCSSRISIKTFLIILLNLVYFVNN